MEGGGLPRLLHNEIDKPGAWCDDRLHILANPDLSSPAKSPCRVSGQSGKFGLDQRVPRTICLERFQIWEMNAINWGVSRLDLDDKSIYTLTMHNLIEEWIHICREMSSIQICHVFSPESRPKSSVVWGSAKLYTTVERLSHLCFRGRLRRRFRRYFILMRIIHLLGQRFVNRTSSRLPIYFCWI